jgi:hypothetical protein
VKKKGVFFSKHLDGMNQNPKKWGLFSAKRGGKKKVASCQIQKKTKDKMSWAILVLVAACLGVVWYMTHSEPERRRKPRDRGRDYDRDYDRNRDYDRESVRDDDRKYDRHSKNARAQLEPVKQASKQEQSPRLLLVYDLVTETEEACEHVIWFSRCEGDGSELDVAHAKNYSSTALMTQEKIAFPLIVGVNVYRGQELFGRGVCTVRGPGEPLPVP